MSMSTHLIALRDMSKDSKFKKMLNLKKACDDAGVHYPKEIENYFGDNICCDDLEDSCMHIELKNGIVRKYNSDGGLGVGLEIDVKDIPSEVKTLRFVNRW